MKKIDIPNKLANFQSLFSYETESILKQNSKFTSRTEELHKEISKINIAQRLDKLDATIAGITQSIQSVLQRLESLERNIKEGQNNKTNIILNEIEKTETRLQEQNKNIENKLNKFETNYAETTKNSEIQFTERLNLLEKQNKTMKILIITIIVLSTITICLNFFD